MFKKNDKIALIANWDGCGTVYIRRGTVHAAGKKVMRVMLANGEMLEQAIYMTHFNTSPTFQVVADADDATLDRMAMNQAEAILAGERDRFDRCLAQGNGEGYDRAIRKNIERLHEARVEWK